MSDEEIIITYQNQDYAVPIKYVRELEALGVQVDENYVGELLGYQSPVWELKLRTLMIIDIGNKEYAQSKENLGRIIKYDKCGNIAACFESVYEATVDALNSNARYSFERLHNEGFLRQKQKHEFFGIPITVAHDHEIIKALNKHIRCSRNLYQGKRKYTQMLYADVADKMSYTEFAMQKIKADSFRFRADVIRPFFNNSNSNAEHPYVKHNIELCADYDIRMKALFDRYSVNGETLFEKVDDLGKYKGYSGIYLLCLPQIKGCYVGQTKKCFATRIPQHFTSPNSAFDTKYGPADIKEIYILPAEEYYVDYLESDCIAVLGNEVCLNALAGGGSVELIKSERYKPENYLLPQEPLELAIQESCNLMEYMHDMQALDEYEKA